MFLIQKFHLLLTYFLMKLVIFFTISDSLKKESYAYLILDYS